MSLYKSFRLPASVYYANPQDVIHSILGNDIDILSIKESDIVLSDGEILVTVEYKSLDFNNFILYKVVETKSLSLSSSKIVATKLINTVDNTELNDLVIVDNQLNKVKYPYIFIKYLGRQNASKESIKYFGIFISSPNSVLKSYCSVIDTEYLSYHGTTLSHTKDFEKMVIPKFKLDADKESKAYFKLNSISSNNFTDTSFSLGHILTRFGLTSSSINILNIIELKDLNENINKPTILSFSGLKIDEIRKGLLNKKGIIIISKFRINPYTVIYIPSEGDILKSENIEAMLMVLDYDVYNYNLISKC